MGRERRPDDPAYYETPRTQLWAQGDIFLEVPRHYAGLSEELVILGTGTRHFLSGPLEPGPALLVTPSCSMARSADAYDHKVRTLSPIVPVSDLLSLGALSEDQVRAARAHDGLINYMYLPEHPSSAFRESVALLYMPITLDHDLLDATARRLCQLNLEAAQQLQRKLAWYYSGIEVERSRFKPPRD